MADPEPTKEDKISQAHMIARALNTPQETLAEETSRIANMSDENREQLFQKHVVPTLVTKRTGTPAVGVQNRTHQMTEDEIKKMIDDATPKERRALRHYYRMKKKGMTPILDENVTTIQV
jgi:hypothetical protein